MCKSWRVQSQVFRNLCKINQFDWYRRKPIPKIYIPVECQVIAAHELSTTRDIKTIRALCWITEEMTRDVGRMTKHLNLFKVTYKEGSPVMDYKSLIIIRRQSDVCRNHCFQYFFIALYPKIVARNLPHFVLAKEASTWKLFFVFPDLIYSSLTTQEDAVSTWESESYVKNITDGYLRRTS